MFLKRVFDIAASFLGLILLLPVFLVLAVLIRLKMPGPVFFRQKRVGRDGKLFTLVKFRTMTLTHSGSSVSVKGESRITPLGAVLRKYKLDELPELWNVLTGDMSFVGPRPDVPGYADKLSGKDRDMLKLRPGITGPAALKYANEEELLSGQSDPVSYNNHVLWPDKVKINLEYLKHRSFFFDLKVILFTLTGRKLSEPWAQ